MSSLDATAPIFVPADRPERYAKAAQSSADAVIIDLEDAVAPDAKPSARTALRASPLPVNVPVFVRINAAGTKWHAEDVALLVSLPAVGVVLPKAQSAAEIAALTRALGPRPVIALIETAEGLAAARAIARTGEIRLAFGSIDFSADIGSAETRDALLAARSEIVLASALARIAAPLDGVTIGLDDEAAVEAEARYAAALGFGGKLCIHPRQIAAVQRGFAPSPQEIAWARRVLAAPQEGVAVVDGAMVDAPVRARAHRLLARIPGRDPSPA